MFTATENYCCGRNIELVRPSKPTLVARKLTNCTVVTGFLGKWCFLQRNKIK